MTSSVVNQQGAHSSRRDPRLVPEVNELLLRLGLGALDENTVTTRSGRNDIWCGTASEAGPVFVKRLIGDAFDVERRTERALTFEAVIPGLRPGPDGPAFRTPRMLGCDESASIFVFAQEQGESGSNLLIDRALDEATARACGRAVAVLHRIPTDGPAQLDTSVPLFPSLELMRGIPQTMFDLLGAAELQMWRLLQRDDGLKAAVARLLAEEGRAPKVPAHCDLRLDQVLIEGADLVITDWEEFRLADPARDLGAFVGECLYRSVLEIVSTRGDADFTALSLTTDDVLRRGVRRIQERRPLMAAFTAGYRAEYGPVDGELARRTAAFAGWHLIDRMIATAHFRPRLLGIERAAAGIGRSIMLNPEKFVESLGLGSMLK